MKRIVVVGSVVIDEIHPFQGPVTRAFGGISYSILGLLRCAPEYRITPVTYVGEADYEAFCALFEQAPNLDLSFVKRWPEGSNRNLLIYRTPEEREEYFTSVTPGLTFRDLLPLLDETAAFLVNYIQPHDLPAQELRTLSHAFREWIYIDIHSLVRERDPQKGASRFRQPPNWSTYVAMGDLIQVNRQELQALTGFRAEKEGEIRSLTFYLLSLGPQVINITLGKEGSYTAVRKGAALDFFHTPAPSVEAADPTGCGDIFGAAFLAEYLRTENPRKAAHYANLWASRKAAVSGLRLPDSEQ